MWLLLLNTQSQSGLPSLDLALPHSGKERVGGKERPFDERTEPSPHSHSFPPSVSSLPCGVNLAKRRQHQPIYTSSSFLFVRCLLPRLYVSTPHPPLCSLCVLVCPHLRARYLCCSSCVGRWNNFKYSKVKDGPTPSGCQHLPHTSCAAEVRRHRYHQLHLHPSSCALSYWAVWHSFVDFHAVVFVIKTL